MANNAVKISNLSSCTSPAPADSVVIVSAGNSNTQQSLLSDVFGNSSVTQFKIATQNSDPTPANNEAIIWLSDGTSNGDVGDLMVSITIAGTTKVITLVDYSAS